MLHLTDSGDNPDFYIENNNGQFRVVDGTNAASKFAINSDGHVDVVGNLDVGAGIDVTGDIISTGRVTAADLTIQRPSGNLSALFVADSGLGTLEIGGSTGAFIDLKKPNSDDFDLRLETQGTGGIITSASGLTLATAVGSSVVVNRNLDVNDGLDVTGNITATGTLACGDITSYDGNGNLTLKDNNHTGNNTEHKISFTASDNTDLINFISPFGEQHLRLRHGTTELVKFQIDGNVGIGTTSPGSLLTLNHATNPAIQFQDSGTKVASINAEGTETNIASFEGKALVFATSTGSSFVEQMRITTGGVVQIGGAIADNADIDTSNTKLTIKQSGGSQEDGIYIERTGERRGYYIYVGGDLGQNDALGIVSQQLGGDTAVLSIDRGGDVVVGAGNLKFNTAGAGIDFSATSNSGGSMSSELLDDYEEGTFTPAVTSGLSAGQISYNSRSGKYTKIGNYVSFSFHMNISSCSLDSGALKFGGMPFTSVNSTNLTGSMVIMVNSGNISATDTYRHVANTTDVAVVTGAGDARAANSTTIDAGNRVCSYFGYYFVS